MTGHSNAAGRSCSSAVLAASFVFNIAQSDGYLGVDNFVNLFELSIEKVIVVIVMAFVIIAGEIDLSVASVMGFAACLVAALHERSGLPFGLVLVIALARLGAASVCSRAGDHQARTAVVGRHTRRADRLAGGGADPRRGPLGGRLSGLVQLARPGRAARPAAVRDPAVHRDVRDRQRHPPPQRVRPLRVRDRRQLRRRPLLGHQGRPRTHLAVRLVVAHRRPGRDPLRCSSSAPRAAIWPTASNSR